MAFSQSDKLPDQKVNWPLQRVDTKKNSEIGLSVDTSNAKNLAQFTDHVVLLSSSNINEGIAFLREGTEEVVIVHSLNELELDVSYYTLNQNRVIRPGLSQEVNLISSDGGKNP
jgi:hypothetical protein